MFTILLRHHLLAKKSTFRDFVREQLRDQLTHDLWWLALSVLLILIIESRNYTLDPVGYSTFNILFEVVSTYSCVGISIGYPGGNRSFCGVWHSPSKLILAVVALHGLTAVCRSLLTRPSCCLTSLSHGWERMLLQRTSSLWT
ncbi:hypothetical protein BJX62DRAFT_23917 [Aspergillus germanicus]